MEKMRFWLALMARYVGYSQLFSTDPEFSPWVEQKFELRGVSLEKIYNQLNQYMSIR